MRTRESHRNGPRSMSEPATGIRDLAYADTELQEYASDSRICGQFLHRSPVGSPCAASESARGERPFLISHIKLHQAIEFLQTYENAHRDKTIGIPLPLQKNVKQFFNRLKGKSHNPVQGYLQVSPGDGGPVLPAIEFATPGIKLLTHASAKGLEFDTVFLPELQDVTGDPTSDDAAHEVLCHVLACQADARPDVQRRGRLPGSSKLHSRSWRITQMMAERVRLFLPVNWRNALEFYAHGLVLPREDLTKYHSDLLELAPRRLPLVADQISRSVTEICTPSAADFPVALEIDSELSVHGQEMNLGGLRAHSTPTGVIPVSHVNRVHVRSERDREEFQVRRYRNVDTGRLTATVSSSLFCHDGMGRNDWSLGSGISLTLARSNGVTSSNDNV